MEIRIRFIGTGTLAMLAALGAAACNSLTGADQLAIVGGHVQAEPEEDDDDFEEPSDSEKAIPGGGAGSPTGAGGSPQTGGHGGATTTTSISGSSSSSSSFTTTSDAVPVNCEYPEGAAGVDVGDLVSGALSWPGFAENASQSSTLSIQDYYDCDGSKGINALLIINSATWCGACQNEASSLPSYANSFAQKGIRVLTLLVENQSGAPATLSTAASWRNYFGLQKFATAADPDFAFSGYGSVGLPLQVLVDPRTMEIVDRWEGYGGYNAVIQLANQNAN